MSCEEHNELMKNIETIHTKLDKINKEYIEFSVKKTLENGYRDKLITDIIKKIEKIDTETITGLKEGYKYRKIRIERFTDRITGGILLAAVFEIITKIIL
jgi:hypothetical protein